MTRNVFPASAAVLTALFLGWMACATQPSKGNMKKGGDRKEAPEFALKDVDGRTVKLSDYRGKVVLLDFWATWCGPCKIEIPWFTEFERQKKDQGFAVLGVSMDEGGWDDVRPFLKDMNVNYRVVMGNDKVAELYEGIEALPTTYLIDRDGRIASKHVGLSGKKDFENEIDELLQQKPQSTVRRMDAGAPAAILFRPGA